MLTCPTFRALLQATACGLLLAALPGTLPQSHLQAGTDAVVPAAFPESTVGMPVSAEGVVLPGGLLQPGPVTDETPVIVRIDQTYPHGTSHRYDLTVYALEPGTYDVSDYLARVDGSSTADLPQITLQVRTLLPAGQIEPQGLREAPLPWLWSYRWSVVVLAVVWMAGLYLLIGRRSRKADADAAAGGPAPLTLADRLRPLVESAVAGQLPPQRLAELERALIALWRQRLSLGKLAPQELLAQLREHREAGPLIRQLESWLHRPGGAQQVDVAALLQPYRRMAPADLAEISTLELVEANT